MRRLTGKSPDPRTSRSAPPRTPGMAIWVEVGKLGNTWNLWDFFFGQENDENAGVIMTCTLSHAIIVTLW